LKSIINFCIIIFFSFRISAQQGLLIKGKILNFKKQAIENASVSLQKKNLIIAYSYTDSLGNYSIQAPLSDSLFLFVASLGYKTKKIFLNEIKNQPNQYLDILLEEKEYQLDDVIINIDLPVVVKKDTIIYSVKHFVQGEEKNVEDLLKKLPNINVDDDGIISVGNQNVDKLLIEGDDMFDKNYQLISKNMPSYTIKKVEILKHYSSNKLLKNIEESDKVALNLILDKKAKNIWFGNIEAGAGNNKSYDYKLNLMNFKKKSKVYLYTGGNNIGRDLSGNVFSILFSSKDEEQYSIENDEVLNPIVQMTPFQLKFKQNRYVDLESHLAFFNWIYKFNDQSKIHSYVLAEKNTSDYFRSFNQNIYLGDENISYTEQNATFLKAYNISAHFDWLSEISSHQQLYFQTDFSYKDSKDRASLLYNQNPLNESLLTSNKLWNSNFLYTHKLNKQSVFLFSGNLGYQNIPQTYSFNRFLYEEILPQVNSADKMRQKTEGELYFGGIQGVYLKKINDKTLQISSGIKMRDYIFQSYLDIFEEAQNITRPDDFINDIRYIDKKIYLTISYLFPWKSVKFSPILNVYTFYKNNTQEENKRQFSPFYFTPGLGVNWKINNNNRMFVKYSYKIKTMPLQNLPEHFMFKNYTSVQKKYGKSDELAQSSLLLNYQLGNWSDLFFMNTTFLFTRSFDYFSQDIFYYDDYSVSKEMLIHNKNFLSINSELDYYFKSLKNNLKFKLSHSQMSFQNKVNMLGMRDVRYNNYSLGMEIKSNYSFPVNYYAGVKWNYMESELNNAKYTSDDFLIYSDFFVNFHSKWKAEIQWESYYLKKLSDDNKFHFIDLEVDYSLIPKKMQMSLQLRNLLNEDSFELYSVFDIGTSLYSFRLNPRLVVLLLEYRF